MQQIRKDSIASILSSRLMICENMIQSCIYIAQPPPFLYLSCLTKQNLAYFFLIHEWYYLKCINYTYGFHFASE